MIGFQIAAQVGQVILSTPLGILKYRMGYSTTFREIAIIVLIVEIYGNLIMKKMMNSSMINHLKNKGGIK